MHKVIASHVAILAGIGMLRVFDPGKAGWKLDSDGKVEMKDGNPVYLDRNGAEMVVESGTISRLNGEAKTHRERAETLTTQLAAFKDIKDPAAALAALETVSKLDAKKLIDAGEVDKLTDQIKAQFTAQIGELTKANGDLQSRYDNSQINAIFAQSDFVRDRLAVPRDMFEASFRNNFKIEDGKIKAFDRDGNPLMSKKSVGSPASPDEALELLVEMHPKKDTILKANTGSGSGNGGAGGGRGGGRFVKRADFEKMDATQQFETSMSANKGELQIVD